MRVWLLVAGGVLLLALTVWPLLRARRPHWISAALLTVLLLPSAGFEISWQYAEHSGSDIVREVSGKQAGYLHCQRLSETLLDASARSGEVRSDAPDRAFITWRTCNDFRGFLLGDRRSPTLDQATAVHVIVHEAIHVSGDYNEASTECKALQADAAVLQRLGTPAPAAAAAVARYRAEVYPNLPARYLSACPT